MDGSDARVRRPGRISDAVKARLGSSAECPKCGESDSFVAYLSTDVISVKLTPGGATRRAWLVGQPQLGNISLMELRCGSCGHRGKPSTFRADLTGGTR